MIKHVVFFKFRPEADPSEIKSILARFRELPDKIDVIREFEIGEDIMRSPRSWDAVLVATYDDLEALEKYARHPDHVEMALKMKEVCDAVGSVDYEL